ncbi:MAG: hypothetical protein LKK00_05775 [Intestinimonas sp.]|jgi:hypothetical protein|nr:hypothetical protein [Intestinimonas sp.]
MMAQEVCTRLLDRYGQAVTLHYGISGTIRTVRALVQPVLTHQEDWRQEVPSPMGVVRKDQFLYFGPANASLDGVTDLSCGGTDYEPQAAQPIQSGRGVSHWWAVLRVRDEEAKA